MPRGAVTWFDKESGDGFIIHRGHRCTLAASDLLDADAGTPGALVHFDLVEAGGNVRAVNVRLDVGSRQLRPSTAVISAERVRPSVVPVPGA